MKNRSLIYSLFLLFSFTFQAQNALSNNVTRLYELDKSTSTLNSNLNSVLLVSELGNSITAGFQHTNLGLNVNFDGSLSSTNTTGYSWDFGDGNSDTGKIVNHIYQDSGFYNVTLKVDNLLGESDSITIGVRVCYTPIANLTYTLVSLSPQGLTVRFDATTSVGADTLIFDLGSAGMVIGTWTHTFHTFPADSSFHEVCLTVKNLCGDWDSTCVSISTIGMSEFNTLDYNFTIYPNPSQDVVNIEMDLYDADEAIDLRLISSNGQVVYEEQVRPENKKLNHKIDVSALSKGFYFVKISSIRGSSMQKLIVE